MFWISSRKIWLMLVQLVGLSGLSMVVNLGVTAGAHELLHLSEEVSYAIALVCVLILNFVALRFKIFKSRKTNAAKQAALFVLCSIVFRGFEFLAWIPIKELVTNHNFSFLWANVIASTLFTVVKYVFYGLTVFRPDR